MFQVVRHGGFIQYAGTLHFHFEIKSILVWSTESSVQNREYVIVSLGVIILNSYSPKCRVAFLLFSSQRYVVERFDRKFSLWEIIGGFRFWILLRRKWKISFVAVILVHDTNYMGIQKERLNSIKIVLLTCLLRPSFDVDVY